jgi:nucleoside-diphosphate-sugar epimerase
VSVLLTGATGFVGRHVRSELRDRGFDAVCLSRRRQAGRGAVCADLTEPSSLDAVPWREVTRVIHCAAATPASGEADFIRHNMNATENLLERLDVDSLEGFVLVSSSAVYGQAGNRIEMDEASTTLEKSGYGGSKRAQETLVERRLGARVPLAVMRLSSVYGAGMAPTLLRVLLERMRAGEEIVLTAPLAYRQNFVHVGDVARILVRALAEGTRGTYNLFSDETVDMDTLVERMRAWTASRSEMVDERAPGGVHTTFSNARIHEAFPDFEFRSLEDGWRTMQGA